MKENFAKIWVREIGVNSSLYRKKSRGSFWRRSKNIFGPECKKQNEGSKGRRLQGGFEEEKGV